MTNTYIPIFFFKLKKEKLTAQMDDHNYIYMHIYKLKHTLGVGGVSMVIKK